MRLWTLHPRYLDRQGLLALWREALLAQAVLRGQTRGYHHHPQLDRFRAQRSPIACIASYLAEVHRESRRRGYRFDRSKIARPRIRRPVQETRGQLLYEWHHLVTKLRKRSPEQIPRLDLAGHPEPHPLFTIIPGEVRDWERGRNRG